MNVTVGFVGVGPRPRQQRTMLRLVLLATAGSLFHTTVASPSSQSFFQATTPSPAVVENGEYRPAPPCMTPFGRSHTRRSFYRTISPIPYRPTARPAQDRKTMRRRNSLSQLCKQLLPP